MVFDVNPRCLDIFLSKKISNEKKEKTTILEELKALEI